MAPAGANLNCRYKCVLADIAFPPISAYSLLAKESESELLSQEEEAMHRGYQYLFSFFVLSAALAAPSAISAAGQPQDNGRQEEGHRDDKDRNRVFDRDHKDYHNWDDREDRSFSVYLGERHREYHPFAEMKEKEKRAYWKWRHSHPDHDHDGR
jgi:Ni/Co efflux regulator RcnB